jgi:hypothetical protein
LFALNMKSASIYGRFRKKIFRIWFIAHII